ncbi:S-layer homology domain-containing protein [Solibacillus silvestris]|uniref:CAP and S-layer homology domain-containing protein n=1 Tax=Solibacillus silvestris TaxID=76853 RepID=UPI003F7DA6EB
MKRILVAGIFIVSLLHTTTTFAQTSPSFSDVKSNYWAAPVIYELVEKGFMEGYKDGTFKPNNMTTRAEAASIVARTMGVELTTDFVPDFNDVSEKHPYYKEICKLAEMGIIQNESAFQPDAPLKRAHITKMIALAFAVEIDQNNKAKFKDLPKNYWAKDYIESLADAGIVKGKTATVFEPNQFVTRAHVAALTKRGMEFKHKVESLELAYDFLQKDYIDTVNHHKQWEKKIVELVNKERTAAGYSPVLQDPKLSQLAIIKAKDMVKRNYFEHVSPFYGNPWDLATLFDYEYTSFGENLARNFKSPETTVAAWMASPKHRENLLKSAYTHMGIGIEQSKNGKYYVVQHFSSK